jgi:hypothetical protein
MTLAELSVNIGANVTGLDSGLNKAVSAIQEFGKSAQVAGAKVGDSLSRPLEQTSESAAGTATALTEVIRAAKSVGDSGKGIASIATEANRAGAGVKDGLVKPLESLVTSAKNAGTSLKGVSLSNLGTQAATGSINTLNAALKTLENGAIALRRTSIGDVGNAISAGFSKATGAITPLIGKFQQAGAAIRANVTNAMEGMANAAKRAGASLQDIGKNLQGLSNQFTSFARTASISITAPLTLLGGASLLAFDRQAKAIAQVENGLKSTGNAAKLTAKELQAAASALQASSLFGDEDILQGVTTQLLTFTNISGQAFLRTQQAAADLATKLGGDLQGAAIQLGKALNDPVANLSALSRSGIQFSESQKATIKALVETNQLAKAQTLILDELERQYGGTAAAAAAAGTGALKQLGNSFGDLTEEFGAIIFDGLKPFISALSGAITAIQGFSPETKKLIVIVGGVAAAIGPLAGVIGGAIALLPIFGSGLAAIGVGLAALTGPIGLAVLGVTALVGTIAFLRNGQKSASDASKEAADAYDNQRKKVEELDQSLRPLMARYEELKGKATRSVGEQQELESIIKKIAGTVPGAVTVFDQYGRAIEISTGYVDEFIKKQKELSDAAKQTNITKQEAELKRLNKALDDIAKKVASGDFTKTINIQGGIAPVQAVIKIDKSELAASASLLEEQKNKVQAYLNELKGIAPAIKAGNEGLEEQKGILAELYKDLENAKKLIATATSEEGIAIANKEAESIQKKIDFYEKLGKTIEKKIGPSGIYAKLNEQLKENQKILDSSNSEKAIEEAQRRMRSINEEIQRLRELGQQREDIQKIQQLRTVNIPPPEEPYRVKVEFEPISGLENIIPPGALEPITQQINAIPQALTGAQKAFMDFGNSLNDIIGGIENQISNVLLNALDSVGEAISGAFSGDISNATQFFDSIFDSLKKSAKQLGMYMLKWGIAHTAMGDPRGPLGIAASVGLFAFAGAGGGGSAAGGVGRASAPAYQNPTNFSAMQITNADNQEVTFRIRGQDLEGVLRKRGFDKGRTGG